MCRLASALAAKKNLRPQRQASSEAASSLSQHSTPVKRPLLKALNDSLLPHDISDTQSTGMSEEVAAPHKRGRPWACLLISLSIVCFGLAAGIVTVAMLPVTPRVLPLIY
jgi:hypothetical protein